MNENADDIAGSIEKYILESRNGDIAAAANAASLIHRYPEISRRLGVNSQYDALLSRILLSDNAEIIVCVAEELAIGKHLTPNGRLAQRFFDRAEMFSPFMGAYVLGRLLAESDPVRAIELFTRAEKTGHIPSTIHRHRILAKRIPIVGRIVGLFMGIKDLFFVWAVILRGARLNERFWRYRDVFPTKLDPVDEKIGSIDRMRIFN